MGKYAAKIKEITGDDEAAFLKLHKDLDRDFVKGMAHIETHGLRCLKMLNNEETWDNNLRVKRETEGRPCLSENLLPDFVNKPHGEFCQSAPQATVNPVDGKGDTKTADVYKGLIYNTAYQSMGAAIHKDAFYYLLAASLTAWRVSTRFASNDSWNVEAVIRPIINPFAVRWDLSAIRPDLSDKKWCHIIDTMDKEEFIKEYGEKAWRPSPFSGSTGTSQDVWWTSEKATVCEVIWIQHTKFTLYELPDGTTSREKPAEAEGEDGSKLRTREAYDKKVYTCVISGTEILTEPIEWPDYTDDPIIPVIIAHGRKIVIAGKTYYKALISDALDIQQLHNYWITAVTEAIALQPDAPYLATEGQVKGFDEWTDLSKKVRYLRYKHDPKAAGPPQRQMPPQVSAAVMNMPQYTRQALRDVIGLQQASLGMTSNERSGKAIHARKAEGDSGKYIFVENITRAISLEAKILVNIYPSIMDTPRIERIMGDRGTTDLAYIKQENPETGEIISLDNGKYDAVVTTGPTFNTQREEARSMISEILQYLGPIAPQAVAAITPRFLELLDMPEANEMAKIMVATLPPQLQAFYQPQEPEMKIPPEVLAQVQAIQEKLAQIQQIAQQQAQMIESLKKEEALKLKELNLKTGIEKDKLQVEREKIARDMTLAREEAKLKKDLKLEEINANIELEMSKLLETLKANKEIKTHESNLRRSEVPAPVVEEKEEEKDDSAIIDLTAKVDEAVKTVTSIANMVEMKPETVPVNLTVVVDGKTGTVTHKSISLQTSDGKVITGNSTEEQS